MQLLSACFIAGPNIYSYRPVIKATIDIGSYEERASNEIEGFVAGLVSLLPGLQHHCCSRGYPGGFVERLQEGTYLAHIFEHVALELQAMCGEEYASRFGKTRGTGSLGVYQVVFGCKSGRLGLAIAEEACRLLTSILNSQTVTVQELVDHLKKVGEESKLGPSTRAIYEAAGRRGIPVLHQDYDVNFLVLGYGHKQQKVWATITGKTSALSVDLVGDKYLTNKLLLQNAVPVPEGYIVTSAAEALRAFNSIAGAVAIKPVNGNHGKGVTLNVSNKAEVERAYGLATQYDERVLVEKYITGRQYRLCVVNGKLAAGAERIPAHVIGDGIHTIAELVARINLDPARGNGHSRPLTYLKLDSAALMTLSRQNLIAESVPSAKQLVYIRDNANLSTGATAKDVSSCIHPDTVRLVERAVRLTGLDIAGVDLVIPDISQPLTGGNGAIIEINAAPGLRMHLYPSAGEAQDLGGAIVDYLFPGKADGRIPIVAVTGTNGKTTVTRLIAHIFGQAGYKTGMTTSSGIYIDQECIVRGDTTGPASTAVVLADPKVEAAVLEVARGGIIRGGLSYDFADVGIITNISEDHIGQDGIEDLEDLAYIKALVIERVRPTGVVLLNADDFRVTALKSRVRSKIIYFSTQVDNIVVRRHLGEGGRACFVKNGAIYLADGQKEQILINIADIPITLGGFAHHNIQNAVIAVAACWAQGLSLQAICKGLTSFSQNPGRLMMMELSGFQVCVDYAHNPAGCQALASTLRRLKPQRLVGVIAAPGDRRDDTIISLGRVAGQGFDNIYIKEDGDLRGRRPGETAALLLQGVTESGMAARQVTTVLDENEAVTMALKQATPKDLIAIFYENFDIVMQAINNFSLSESEKFQRQPACQELVVAGMQVKR